MTGEDYISYLSIHLYQQVEAY